MTLDSCQARVDEAIEVAAVVEQVAGQQKTGMAHGDFVRPEIRSAAPVLKPRTRRGIVGATLVTSTMDGRGQMPLPTRSLTLGDRLRCVVPRVMT